MASTYFVYVLECQDGAFYVGQTNNFHARLAEHRGYSPREFASTGQSFMARHKFNKVLQVHPVASEEASLRLERGIALHMALAGMPVGSNSINLRKDGSTVIMPSKFDPTITV